MDFILEGFLTAIRLLLTGDAATFSAVSVTLRSSFLAMAASLLLGLPLGFLLGYAAFPGRRQARTVADSLMSLPTVLIGLLVYAFLSRRGPLGDLGLLFTIPGIAIGLTLLALPMVIALTAATVEGMDRHLRITLLSLGADRLQILLSTLWEVRYGLLTAAAAAFGRVLTEVGVSMMVGGNIKWQTRTMTTAIALETGKGEFALGVALGLILLFIAFGVNYSVSFLRRRT